MPSSRCWGGRPGYRDTETAPVSGWLGGEGTKETAPICECLKGESTEKGTDDREREAPKRYRTRFRLLVKGDGTKKDQGETGRERHRNGTKKGSGERGNKTVRVFGWLKGEGTKKGTQFPLLGGDRDGGREHEKGYRFLVAERHRNMKGDDAIKRTDFWLLGEGDQVREAPKQSPFLAVCRETARKRTGGRPGERGTEAQTVPIFGCLRHEKKVPILGCTGEEASKVLLSRNKRSSRAKSVSFSPSCICSWQLELWQNPLRKGLRTETQSGLCCQRQKTTAVRCWQASHFCKRP